jgi:hypothetical protein
MPIREVIQSLGGRSVVKDSSQRCSIEELESTLNIHYFSDEYKELLTDYSGSILFDKGAIYRPKRNSPVDSSNGYQSLEMLYGLKGDSNLSKRNAMYKDQIPLGYLVIGESVGGNQICISKENGKIYFWFHESETESESLYEIADSVDVFLHSLVADNDVTPSEREIDETGSYLDF